MARAKHQYQRIVKRLVNMFLEVFLHLRPQRLSLVFQIFFVFLSINSIQAAEKTTLSLEPPKAIRGQKVTIRIRTAIPWGGTVHIEKPELSRVMAWWALPYARPWRTSNEDGSFNAMVEVLAAIQIDRTGFHSIAPFLIKSDQGEAKTAAADIVCVNTDEKDFPFPVFANWHSIPAKLWQGQTVPIVLEAQNLAFLARPDSVTLNNVPAGILEETSNSGRISTRYNNDTVIYDVPMASWLWTLAEPGNFSFPGARFSVSGITRSIQGFSVQVQSLPEKARVSGAVGFFSLKTEWDEQVYRTGDILPIRISILGEGNMKVLIPPSPEIQGVEYIKSSPSSSWKSSLHGYQGIRTTQFEYRILKSAANAGELIVRIPDWTYFQPEGEGRIHTIPASEYRIAVEAANEKDMDSIGNRFLGADMFHYRAAVFHSGSIWPFLFTLPGGIVLVFLFFRRRRSIFRSLPFILVLPILISAKFAESGDTGQAARTKQLALEKKWDAVIHIHRELTAQYGELPGLLHDRAIVEAETGRPGKAVSLMRRALYLKPGNRWFLQTLKLIEKKLSLREQIPPIPRWPPSLMFLLWLLGVNLLLLVMAWNLYKLENKKYILLISALIYLLASTGALVYTESIWKKPVSIVAIDNQTLYRIPDPLAVEWVKLPAGTTVLVKAIEGQNCLVQTGFGLEGWLPFDALNNIDEDEYGL